MKILVTGKGGKSGSWAIRASQLGGAIGAKVQANATLQDCQNADLIIVVKRTPDQLMQNIYESGKPWVFDIVDGWNQWHYWQPELAVQWLQKRVFELKPHGVVYGTHRMMEDAKFLGLVLPHHAWTKYSPIEVREKVKVVGYEGSAKYLERWHDIVQTACNRRGWQFMINGDMSKADIGIALRGNGGYPAKYWKPGTKLANLHALGLPAICSYETGYHEIQSGLEEWVINAQDIDRAFDTFEPYKIRLDINRHVPQFAPRLINIAEQYKEWIIGVL